MTVDEKFALINDLVFRSYKFSFVKAVDLVFLWQNKLSGCHLDANTFVDDSVFFKSSVLVRSFFSEVSSIDGFVEERVEVEVNFLGSIGIDGNFPDIYLENYVFHPGHQVKAAVKDFFNIFNHRMISFWYLISKKYVSSCYSCLVLDSFIGRIIHKLSSLEEYKDFSDLFFPDQFYVSYQDLFWKKNRSAEGLRILLSSFFRISVTIEQFVGQFVQADRRLQTKIGTKVNIYNILGESSVLGNKVWDQMSGISIHLHNLQFDQYCSFFPKASRFDRKFSNFEKLKIMVKSYVPVGVNVRLFLHMQGCATLRLTLGGLKRLGEDSFLGTIVSPVSIALLSDFDRF
jgi:type VI secretion system protein ImpH